MDLESVTRQGQFEEDLSEEEIESPAGVVQKQQGELENEASPTDTDIEDLPVVLSEIKDRTNRKKRDTVLPQGPCGSALLDLNVDSNSGGDNGYGAVQASDNKWRVHVSTVWFIIDRGKMQWCLLRMKWCQKLKLKEPRMIVLLQILK